MFRKCLQNDWSSQLPAKATPELLHCGWLCLEGSLVRTTQTISKKISQRDIVLPNKIFHKVAMVKII